MEGSEGYPKRESLSAVSLILPCLTPNSTRRWTLTNAKYGCVGENLRQKIGKRKITGRLV